MLDLEEYDEPSKLEEIAFKQLDFAQKETDLGSKSLCLLITGDFLLKINTNPLRNR